MSCCVASVVILAGSVVCTLCTVVMDRVSSVFTLADCLDLMTPKSVSMHVFDNGVGELNTFSDIVTTSCSPSFSEFAFSFFDY